MAKKRQKRRCLSIRGLDHQRAMAYCAQQDRSLSGLVEELLAAHLDKEGQPRETILRPRVWGPGKSGPKRTPNAVESERAAWFTL